MRELKNASDLAREVCILVERNPQHGGHHHLYRRSTRPRAQKEPGDRCQAVVFLYLLAVLVHCEVRGTAYD
jgi:hypothetical protein